MPTTNTIQQCRLSLIWVETNTALLGDPKPPNAPMSFLGNRDTYAAMFDQVRKQNGITGLRTPWDKSGQRFWRYYLEGKPPLEDMPGDKAWRFLVPFRGQLPVRVTAPWLSGDVVLDSFFYPYGFALVATATSRTPQSLTDVVKLAFKIRKDDKLDAQWDSGALEHLHLNQLAGKCLTVIRQAAQGPAAAEGIISDEPFTVLTILKGEATGLDGPLSPAIHRALEAVTAWPNVWEKAKLPELDEKVKLPLKASAADSDLVYARKRGRAVWFPDLFTDTQKVRSSLSCYHKNLVLASMQVDSLSGLCTATAPEIDAGNWLSSLPLMHKDCAKLAGGILGRMYALDTPEKKMKATYRSLSPRYHIQQNALAADINAVRTTIGDGAALQ